MFSEISTSMKSRMEFLESADIKDRIDGTERSKRLRQIPPETGKFISLIAANCPQGEYIEIGTSAGYSSLWISLALKSRNIKLKTFEILHEKVLMAEETFRLSGIHDNIELIEGDFLSYGADLKNVAFCFLDCEKHLYKKCFDLVADKIISGGMLVADNAINHYESLKPMIDSATSDNRFDCLTVPIGNGEFLCRRK